MHTAAVELATEAAHGVPERARARRCTCSLRTAVARGVAHNHRGPCTRAQVSQHQARGRRHLPASAARAWACAASPLAASQRARSRRSCGGDVRARAAGRSSPARAGWPGGRPDLYALAWGDPYRALPAPGVASLACLAGCARLLAAQNASVISVRKPCILQVGPAPARPGHHLRRRPC